MKHILSGLLVFIISCSGIYYGCEKKSSKTEPAKSQIYTNDLTMQSVASNATVTRQPGKKFGPFDIDNKRIVVTNDYGDAITGDLLEIKDETGVSYFKETYRNDDESSYTVEGVFKLVGKSGEGLIIISDEGPTAPPCGPEFQVFGMGSGSLKALSPRISVCGTIEKLPEGTANGVLKLLDGDVINVEIWNLYFGIRVPFQVDFQKLKISPFTAQGVFDINIPYSIDPIDTTEGNAIKLYADHDRNSKAQSIAASEIKKVEFVSSYAYVQLEKVSEFPLEIKITNVWLKVKVNGQEGWTYDVNDFHILGLMPVG